MARYNNVFLRFVDIDGVAHFPDCRQENVTEARKYAKAYSTDKKYFDDWAESKGAHEKLFTVKVMNRGRGSSDTHPEEVLGEYQVNW